ncbi:MAG TPA: Ig-like domain-containing protein [Gemmatimonadales bacterium]|nr:Ig-like domain-containing protein [Gemmatimonadales bacterium]
MIIAGCAKEVTGPRIASLTIVSGTGQTGPIGLTLSQPLTVRATDQNGQPAPGLVVHWQVTAGGGVVTPSESTTDENGEASATLRLGTSIGVNTVSATLSASAPGVEFTATATGAQATKLLVAAGAGQSGVVGSTLAQDLTVLVTDALDNPKAGVTVSFAVLSGGGSLSATSAITSATGTATVRWTLGNIAGTQSVIVSATGVAPITITATALPSGPDAITIVSGNSQSGPRDVTLPTPLVVRVTDRAGNPVSGVLILWTPAAGGGTVSPTSSFTDANGRATTTWTPSGVGGPVTVVASGGGLSVTFTAGVNVNYESISAGGRNTCGITVDNVMLCWGYNGEGQLGIGQPPLGSGPVFAYPQPTSASGNLSFRQTVVDLYHGCAITLASVGYCWGVNHDGRLGTNSVIPSNAPIQVLTALSFRMMAVSRNHTCGLSLSDRVYCWGYSGDGQVGIGLVAVDSILIPTEVVGGLRFQAVVAGGQHACAITTAPTGSVAYCWGFNSSGQLGDGSTTTQVVPTLVSGGLTIKDVSAPIAGHAVPLTIAAGYDHTCAIAASGPAYCWGRNASGQLGNGGTTNSTSPVAVSGGLTFSSISAGESHSCALTAAGLLYCWGSNASGQLGDGTTTNRTAPTGPVSGGPYQWVSAGDQHTCAITTTHLAFCWGDNQYGQLGTGAQGLAPVTAPAKVKFQP